MPLEVRRLEQLGRLLVHGDGVAKEDHRLVALRRGGVDLGAAFAVGRQPVQADAGSERGFAGAFSGLDVGAAKAPGAVVDALPSVEAADDEGLPSEELELGAFVLAAVEVEDLFEEGDGVRGGGLVPAQATVGGVLEVVQMAASGGADVRAGDDFAGDDLAGPGAGAVDLARLAGLALAPGFSC